MSQYTESKTENENCDCPNGSNCPIFKAMVEYQFTEDKLAHMQQYRHDSIRKDCRYGDSCKAYLRMCSDCDYRLDDRCHMAIYKHPPRARCNEGKPKEWNTFLLNDGTSAGHFHNRSTRCSLGLKDSDCLVADEVTKNGFGYVLRQSNGRSLSEVVTTKLKHPRNIALSKLKMTFYNKTGFTNGPCSLNYDEMLSVILYTGCDVYKDLRESERKGDYQKWKIVGASLDSAIRKLSLDGNQHKYDKKLVLYSGMASVYFDGKANHQFMHLDTFTSFSWKESVALKFCGNNGMVFRLAARYGGDDGTFYDGYGTHAGLADVSWISKFPDECEFLLNRDFPIMAAFESKDQICWKKSPNGKVQIIDVTLVDG